MRLPDKRLFSRISWNASCMYRGFTPVLEEFCPREPRFGITNACITARRLPPDSSRTASRDDAAMSTGSGLLSGDEGTAESTAKFVEESRKTSLIQWNRERS